MSDFFENEIKDITLVEDWNETIEFGKYKNTTFQKILDKNPSYLKWLIENTQRVTFPEKMEKIIIRRSEQDKFDPYEEYRGEYGPWE